LGVYGVGGTIGQLDAGRPSGGNFSLDGGFWGIIATVQTVSAPQLSIQLTATNTVIISWPSPSSGFNLQQNTNLTTSTWVAPSESVGDDGKIKFIIVNPADGQPRLSVVQPMNLNLEVERTALASLALTRVSPFLRFKVFFFIVKTLIHPLL
jgi:hypothetical protein